MDPNRKWTLQVRRADSETWEPLSQQTANDVLGFIEKALKGQPHNWIEVRRIECDAAGS